MRPSRRQNAARLGLNVMQKMDKNEFVDELMFTGDIVQDSDESVPWPEREDRFKRYIELLDSVNGDEGLEIARAIIRSMQAEQDYGAYQTTQSTLGKFPSEIYIKALISELPRLIQSNSEWAGELLCGLANSVERKYSSDIELFNKALANAEPGARDSILNYIKEQERDGWLEHRAKILGS